MPGASGYSAPMPLPPKAEIVAALCAGLETELAALERMAAASRDEVGSDETKNEGKYDTRSTEASYLARGLAFRIADLRQVVAWFQLFDASWRSAVVQAGALIQLDDDLLFMAPVGGGRVRVGDRTVTIISPASPLGEALAGLEPGDVAEIDSPRGILSREVRAIA